MRTLENSLDNKNVEQFIFYHHMIYVVWRRETDFCDPIELMSIKVLVEKIIKAYEQVFNLPYTILAIALYGERCIQTRSQIFIEMH